MSAAIRICGLAKRYAAQTLFEGVTLDLSPGNRYGIVGANGAGKSTFARILAGDEAPSEGTLSIPKRARIGVLRQDRFESDEQRILEVALMGHREVYEAMKERSALLSRAEESFDVDRFAALEEIIARHDGYSLEAKAGEILEGLGIPTELHGEPLRVLSGGFKLRVLLAQTLASDPDLLILDEPTNHLDILSIRWLERFMLTFPGTAVVISHDRRFLDNVCTHIADVDYQTITLYPGNYEAFEAQKAAERARKEAEIQKREKQIAEHQAFVDRFRAKASKARQAQSRIKQIERITLEKLPESSRRYPRFSFPQRRPSGREVLELKGIGKAYGDKRVLSGVSLMVRRGERVAIIGPNGVGKSTLLKIIVGKLAPDEGAVRWGHETYPGYFAQDHRELITETSGTIESWLWAALPEESRGSIRSRLGAVLFSGDEADKPLSALSGGEAARLIFARLMAEAPNVLLLDEPTNHLDLEAIEALADGLHAYEGTLLFVSHDRWFVSKLATRVIELWPDGITDYPGTYEEYVAKAGDDHLDVEQVSLKAKRERGAGREQRPEADGRRRESPERRKKRLCTERDRVTAALEKAEARLAEIHAAFCAPGFFEETSPEEIKRLQAEEKKLLEEIERSMEEWERVEAELEEALKQG